MDGKVLTLLRGIYLAKKHDLTLNYDQIISGYVEANHEMEDEESKQAVTEEIKPFLDSIIKKSFIELCPCGCEDYLLTEKGLDCLDIHLNKPTKEGISIFLEPILKTLLEEFEKEEQDEDPSSSHSPTPKPRFHYPDPSEN
jgi:hypothetical protein